MFQKIQIFLPLCAYYNGIDVIHWFAQIQRNQSKQIDLLCLASFI